MSSTRSAALGLYHDGKITLDEYSRLVGGELESKRMIGSRGFGGSNVLKACETRSIQEDCAVSEPPVDDITEVDPPVEEDIAPPPQCEESEWILPSPPEEVLPEEVLPEEVPAPDATAAPAEDEGIGEGTVAVVVANEDQTRVEYKADKCWLWCFRCPPRLATHEITFGSRKLPVWLRMEGTKNRLMLIPTCCHQCNAEFRATDSTREQEEQRIREGFWNLKISWDNLTKDAREMAEARAGRKVGLFTRVGKVAHLDVERFRERLKREDSSETLDLERFRAEGRDCGLGRQVGGLF